MRLSVAKILLLFMLSLPAVAAAETQEYVVDPTHSGVGFKVRHLLAKTPGSFNEYEGRVWLDPAKPAETLKLAATIQAASVDTRNEKRDGHLRGPDFFDAEKSPEIRFESTGVKPAGENKFEVAGNLTMRGVTKPVTLTAELLGTGTSPFTKTPMLGLDLTGMVNRKEYGLVWNKQLDDGGWLLGEDVAIDVHLEAAVAPEQAES